MIRMMMIAALLGLLSTTASAKEEPATAEPGAEKAAPHRKEARDKRRKARDHAVKAKMLDKKAEELEESGDDEAAAGAQVRAEVQKAKALGALAKSEEERAAAAAARKERIKTLLDKKGAKLKPGHRKLLENAADRAERREERRDARAAKLRARALERLTKVGAPKRPAPAVRQEMRRHARRMARLHRVLSLAIDAEDYKTAELVEKLIEKEETRHEKWIAANAATAPEATPAETGEADSPAAGDDSAGAKIKGGVEAEAAVEAEGGAQ